LLEQYCWNNIAGIMSGTWNYIAGTMTSISGTKGRDNAAEIIYICGTILLEQ
jgi:hypothetical protein